MNQIKKKTKQNEKKMENLIDDDIGISEYFESATTNKIYVNGLNLNEIKNEVLEVYTGDFELIGYMMIGEMEQKTNSRFKIVDDFETYINAKDNGGCDSEDVSFTESLYKLNTPDFGKLNRSQSVRGTNFKRDNVEYIGNNCYFPTSGNCFINCNIHLTGKVYMNELLTFTRDEQRWSKVMTSAKIQTFCMKQNIKIGC